ncbi:hypothetical protein C7293_13790 [filamentous cyanobacterium CCT1]|nr:hypothetical protein C7293_13790 [filamentous cyanobacterium CCT1]PSN80394.1 hypothetical protein C8B47_06720 [filamentous cyanobacterium CCP4]
MFDLFCYAVAILAVLLFVGEAPEPTPDPVPPVDDLPSLPELLAEAEALTARPVPAVAAEAIAPVAVARVEVEPVATIDYAAMTSVQLRKECSRRGVAWRGVRDGGKHLTKPQMLEALGA